MKIVFAIFLILISANSAAIDVLTTIPATFQGNWSHRIDECGLHPLTKDTYPSHMTITKNGIRHYESSGKVATIVRRNKKEIAMILEYSGGGDFWLAYKYFIMSDDKKTISDESNPRRIKTIYRCADVENDAYQGAASDQISLRSICPLSVTLCESENVELVLWKKMNI